MSEASTTNHTWNGFERDHLPPGLDVPAPQRAATAAKLLVALFVAISLAALLAPWTQNIRGRGRVIAYSPDQRQQNIEATVSGTIAKWFVQEGSQVRKGDPIVQLADNDARILERLATQRSAIEIQ
ncbi:MAG: biotin/lipoyl-binding protein, partial [Myxococcales bacterium]